jgi:hypothetical protein
MPERIVPMIHVSDVEATAYWYSSIGFDVRATNRESEGGKIDWTLLRLGQSEIMLNAGGLPSSGPRRDFDLYVHVNDIDELRTRIDGKGEIVEELHHTFYSVA